MRQINAYEKIHKRNLQEKAVMDYTLAATIISGVGIALGSKQKFHTLYETYPQLFAEEAEKEKLARQIEYLRGFTNQNNLKF